MASITFAIKKNNLPQVEEAFDSAKRNGVLDWHHVYQQGDKIVLKVVTDTDTLKTVTDALKHDNIEYIVLDINTTGIKSRN